MSDLATSGRRSTRRSVLTQATALALGAALARSAAAFPAASAADAEGDILYSVTIPAEALPKGAAVVGIGRFEFGVGASLASPPKSQPPSVAIEVVLEGRYGVTSDGPLLVIRADSQATPFATPPAAAVLGQEVELGPSDVVVYFDNDRSTQLARNLGDAPVVGIAAGVFSTALATAKTNVEGEWRFDFLAFAEPGAWAAIPPGPVTLTLARRPATPTDALAPGVLRLEGAIEGEDGVFVLTVVAVAG